MKAFGADLKATARLGRGAALCRFWLPFINTPLFLRRKLPFSHRRPDGKYFQPCQPNGLGRDYQFAFGAEKQVQTIHTQAGVAVFQKTVRAEQARWGSVTGRCFPALGAKESLSAVPAKAQALTVYSTSMILGKVGVPWFPELRLC